MSGRDGANDDPSTLAEHGDTPSSAENGDTPDPADPDDHPGVFGEATPAGPIEPGTPSAENVAFVVLGVASTVGLVVHLVSLVR